MRSNTIDARAGTGRDLAIMILVLGSLWGFSEVVLSDIIRAQGIPLRAGILTGIGLGIMGIATGLSRRALPLLGIAMVTIAAKQLVVPLLQCSALCRANTCAAVLIQGLALSSVVAFAGHRLAGSVLTRAAAGASAALLSAGAFYAVGTHLAPCQYLLSFASVGGLSAFLQAEGLAWAAFSALLFPAGYRLGTALRDVLPAVAMQKPAACYITAAAGIVGCWAAITASIMNNGI